MPPCPSLLPVRRHRAAPAVPVTPSCTAPRAGAAAVLACAVAAVACAAPRPPSRDLDPPEVLVEVLPGGAELTVDGRSLGPGAHTVPVPDAAHRYRLRATAPGFAPAERVGEGARLAGTRVGLVLSPAGSGRDRPIDLDDGESLAAAALALERAGALAAGLEYAERAVEAAPRSPRAQRVLAEIALALGRRTRAADAYAAYLRLDPSAPDRAALERRVEELRGDRALPGIERR